MKKVKILALIAAMMIFSSCTESGGGETPQTDGTGAPAAEEYISVTSANAAEVAALPAEKKAAEEKPEAIIYLNKNDGIYYNPMCCTDAKEAEKVLSYINSLSEGSPVMIDRYCENAPFRRLRYSKTDDTLDACADVFRSDYGYYIKTSDGNEYAVDDGYKTVFDSVMAKSTEEKPQNRLYGCSVKCDEPQTIAEYISAAEACTAVWLDSLKNESGSFRLEGYSFEDAYHKTKILAVGCINGVKEFAAEVHFEVYGTGRNSVFEGGNRDFHDLHYGPVVYVRCKWEDGVCDIVDFKRNDGYAYTDFITGLNGISEEEKYPTFYDFMNDEEAVKKYLAKEIPDIDGSETNVLARNVFMTSTGRIYYCDIYSDEKVTETADGKYRSGWSNWFFTAGGVGVYNSSVSYNENAMVPYQLEFSKDIKFEFDDYNYDGNPDWLIKTKEDENGSYYNIECTANDGSPRGYGSVTYMAGTFEDTIRLQRNERGFIRYDIDENGRIIPIQPAIRDMFRDEPIELEKFRMYSQKYYIKDTKRAYSENEKEIICYFWNNSDTPVSAGGTYYIEKLENGKWVKVTGEKKSEIKTAEPRCYAEIKFDISDIPRDVISEYRVVTTADGEIVYGGFYAGSAGTAEIEITAEKKIMPADRTSIIFTVKNTGTDPLRISSASLSKDGKTVSEINVNGIGLLNGDRETAIEANAELGEYFGAGEYTLTLCCGGYEYSGSVALIDVPDDEKYYFQNADVKLTDSGLIISAKNNIWDKSTAERACFYSTVEVLRGGKWQNSDLMEKGSIDGGYSYTYSQMPDIPYGETLTGEYISVSEYYENNDELREEYRERYEDMLENPAAYGYNSAEDVGTFSEYFRKMYEYINASDSAVTPESGELCRVIANSGEYVYFWLFAENSG